MLVILESPYMGDITENMAYAQQCMEDSLRRGESPFASHLLYTQVLNDCIPEERKLGIEAGLKWAEKAQRTVVYIDRGISAGMRQGIDHALAHGRGVEFRSLYYSL